MFDAKGFVEEMVEELRTAIPGRAIIACSGGVDTTVAAVMVAKAIGDRLSDGLRRHRPHAQGGDRVRGRDVRRLGINYGIVDAKDEFFDALKGVSSRRGSARSSGRGSSGSSNERPRSSAPSTWSKGPSLRTGSRAVTVSGTPSRATTTWVGCPRTCT